MLFARKSVLVQTRWGFVSLLSWMFFNDGRAGRFTGLRRHPFHVKMFSRHILCLTSMQPKYSTFHSAIIVSLI